jgi:hypothetical protein
MTMRACDPIFTREGTVLMEFSNVMLLVLGLGAAVLNPLFDLLAPKIAALFGRRSVSKEPCESC